jgi:signal transduction histidine kinase/ActR/RegA family two-component response regulator
VTELADVEDRVLVFASFAGDAALTQRMLEAAHIATRVAASLDELLTLIAEGAGAAVLAEETLSPSAVGRLLELLGRQPPWSDLPLIVSTQDRDVTSADARILRSLAAHTNLILLDRPVRVRTMVTTVRGALRARRRQYEARGLLRQLELGEARFRRVQEASPDGLMILKPLEDTRGAIVDFVWTYANPAAERVMGKSSRELAGRRLSDELPQTRSDGHFEAYLRAYLGRESKVIDLCHDRAGEQRIFRNVAFRLDDDLALIFEDITERRRVEIERQELLAREKSARERAEATNRSKDEFLATVSHELRTPLNAMLGWARMLNSSHLGEQQTRRALEAIERNAVAQAHLIEDLLDVSRIISGKLRLSLEEVELGPVIEAAIESVRPALDAKQIEFSSVIAPSIAAVRGDPNRLQQVVWNLLSNAIKFTPRQGRIRLFATQVNALAEVTVVDDGQGIDSAFAPYLFQRFEQADSTITRAQGGLGLGLSISRHLVELHGGTIEAHSDGPGCGATFRFKLPVISRRPAELERPSPPSSRRARGGAFERPPELDGLRVLVVDDELDARELLIAVLSQCGSRPIAAASAAEALAVVTSSRPDVIVSDIGMPEQNGYELIRRVRALPASEGGRTPAAALTAYARAEDRSQAMHAGFEMHLVKPIEPSELISAIATLARIGSAMK